MASSSNRLPSRFPVGTKFVIEGRRGGEGELQVYSRYLEFPDGTFSRCRPTRCSANPVSAAAPARRVATGTDRAYGRARTPVRRRVGTTGPLA